MKFTSNESHSLLWNVHFGTFVDTHMHMRPQNKILHFFFSRICSQKLWLPAVENCSFIDEHTPIASSFSVVASLSSHTNSLFFQSQLKTCRFHESFPPYIISLPFSGLTRQTLDSCCYFEHISFVFNSLYCLFTFCV